MPYFCQLPNDDNEWVAFKKTTKTPDAKYLEYRPPGPPFGASVYAVNSIGSTPAETVNLTLELSKGTKQGLASFIILPNDLKET